MRSWVEPVRESRCGAAGLECGPPEVGVGPVTVRVVCCLGVREGDGRGDDELRTRTEREKMESERAEAAA